MFKMWYLNLHPYSQHSAVEMGISVTPPALTTFPELLPLPRKIVKNEGDLSMPVSLTLQNLKPEAHQNVLPPETHWVHAMTPIVGREVEAAQVAARLDEGMRLISIVGIGGAGKSVFLRSQCARLLKWFNNRVDFVDLRDSEAVNQGAVDHLLESLAATLECTLNPNVPKLSQIVEALDKQVSCLILDNFQATTATVKVIETLLGRVPQLTVIVTSRTRLHLRGEYVLTMQGLPTEVSKDASSAMLDSDAMRLFVEHARRDTPDFVVDDNNRELVNFICRQLDGLPLALVLAAQQVSFYGLAEVASSLRTSNALLQSEYRDSAAAQQSVDAVLTYTWHKLTNEEQQLWVAATCFAGKFHQDWVQSIASVSYDAFVALQDAALLKVIEPGWYRLSPLAKRHLASRDDVESILKQVKRQYMSYFLGQLHVKERQLDSAAVLKPEAFARLQRLRMDLFAAWRYAVADRAWDLLPNAIISLGRFVETGGYYTDGIRLFQLLLDHLPPTTWMSAYQQRLADQANFFVNLLSAQENLNLDTEAQSLEANQWVKQTNMSEEGGVSQRYSERRRTIPPQVAAAMTSTGIQKSRPAYA